MALLPVAAVLGDDSGQSTNLTGVIIPNSSKYECCHVLTIPDGMAVSATQGRSPSSSEYICSPSLAAPVGMKPFLSSTRAEAMLAVATPPVIDRMCAAARHHSTKPATSSVPRPLPPRGFCQQIAET